VRTNGREKVVTEGFRSRIVTSDVDDVVVVPETAGVAMLLTLLREVKVVSRRQEVVAAARIGRGRQVRSDARPMRCMNSVDARRSIMREMRR
jgi:hypothetical protein